MVDSSDRERVNLMEVGRSLEVLAFSTAARRASPSRRKALYQRP